MKTKDRILELKSQGKNIPEICKILGVGKGTVGYHLKTLGFRWDGVRTEEHKEKISKALNGKSRKGEKKEKIKSIKKERFYDYWPLLNGEVEHIGTYNNSIRVPLKRFIIRNNIIPYLCNECGCDDNWRGKKMPLILDHINGVRDDNKLTNLRFLCSNCDSIQDTYKGKNKKYLDQ